MIKRLLLSLILFIVLFNPTEVLAIENPLSTSNNIFGIHILDENDLENAAELVNSSGGDWGYVTFVIRKDERDTARWQKVFDKMRRLHLIPIVRIATRQQNGGWEKPSFDEIDGWVSFLNELNWVVKNRYIVVGNEPNHAKEWGREVSPEEYAEYLFNLSRRLKETSDDFFILPAGFDASAPNGQDSMSEEQFLRKMISKNSNIFDYVDGWTSHSYPNPEFSGSSKASGRGTVRTFEWELQLLESLGIEKDLQVFVTETGWAHNMESNFNGYKDPNSISTQLKNAFQDAWGDERIVAVTPFILRYQEEPFNIFSWTKRDGRFYDFYYEIQSVNKTPGVPTQIISGELTVVLFPPLFGIGDKKYGFALAKNTGQSIWEVGQEVKLVIGDRGLRINSPLYFDIEPNQTGIVLVERI